MVIQVKNISATNDSTPRYQCRRALLEYSKVISAPLILLGVDTDREVVYWRHIDPVWVEELNLGDQMSKVIEFPEDNLIDGKSNHYIRIWQKLSQDAKEIIADSSSYDLNTIITEGENEQIEFKSALPANVKDITKEVVALANNEGGNLLIGVRDDGSVVGVEDAKKMEERVAQILQRSIDPIIQLSVEIQTVMDKEVVRIDIPKAKNQLYSIDGTFYIRVGTVTSKMTWSDIQSRFNIQSRSLCQADLSSEDSKFY